MQPLSRTATLAIAIVLALALAGCSSAPPRPIANTAGDEPGAADRCRAIPPRTRRGADCADAGPRNSDGSAKELAPPAPGQRGKWLVLDYGDLGPSAMSAGLVGSQWWSWSPGGSWEMCDEFDIHVVVYNDEYRDPVAELYPTVPGESDNRLLSRTAALAFLDEQIADLATDAELWSLRESLERTRATIDDCLR